MYSSRRAIKSYLDFITENPVIEEPQQNYIRTPIKNITIPANSYSLGSMNVDGKDYHFHGHIDKPRNARPEEIMHAAYISTKGDDGNHSVVGNVDFYQNFNDKTFSGNFPKLNVEHSKRGLMSELYKRWADHNKTTIQSSRLLTVGGKNVWDELAKKGDVVAHNTFNGRKILVNPNQSRHQRLFYRPSSRAASGSPVRWVFRYTGK